MKRIFKIVLLGILIYAGWSIIREKTITSKIINYTPYPIKFSYAYGEPNKGFITAGWYTLNSGESYVIKKTYRIKQQQLFIHAQSNAKDIVRWAYNLDKESEGIVYFEGDILFLNPNKKEPQYLKNAISEDEYLLFGYQKIVSPIPYAIASAS